MPPLQNVPSGTSAIKLSLDRLAKDEVDGIDGIGISAGELGRPVRRPPVWTRLPGPGRRHIQHMPRRQRDDATKEILPVRPPA